jgi:hypothetical protein
MAMRVTIEHREVATGVLGKHKDSYIDCTVNFSEEERAIIKERDLYGQGFSVRTSTPLPPKTSMLGTGLMRLLGPVMMIGGVVWGLAGGGTPTGLLFFAGLGFVVYGWLRSRREDKRFETSEQELTLKQLLNHPTFTVHAWNPASAKGLEETIRDNLVGLKNLIQNSAQLQAKQTFEL